MATSTGLRATLCAGLLLAASGVLAAKNDAPARYLIQYHPGQGEALKALITAQGGSVAFDYAALIDGLAADLSPEARRAVRSSGLATTIEEDTVRELHVLPGGFPLVFDEFVGWGPDRIQADVLWSAAANLGAAADGAAAPSLASAPVTGFGVVVGVLDSGIDYQHPDLAANILDLRGDGAIRDFLDGDADPTDSAGNGHGSSVASVIASVDNNVGVIGVAPQAWISPYRVCNVNCPLSAIIGGLVQATVDGVDVINMSFGGPAGFNLEASAVQAANARGVVLVASAGNESSQKPSFPAAYGTVIAVGATSLGDAPASFTNVGGWVDVTGPGVDVAAATCGGCGRLASMAEVSPTARDLSANPMTGTALGNLAAAQIVDVGRACNGDAMTDNPAGQVALVVRGACAFSEKVANAEAAGAVATVVFNNAPGNFAGTLGTFTAAGPAVSLSQAEGQALAADIAGGATLVNLSVVATDYELVSGTSFSGPHVAGVAALVLAVNPYLTPVEVRTIIRETAEALGPQVIFGTGMVRADWAVDAAQ